ncbi:hypothetical protein MITS9509_00390 [Synechococcus sp. MIT S9509]|uniref:hypothetical protein n=1 Tax=unclassified Synechococcus TaxID=2626047 RepID=UPI0007BAEFA3|nr:MULTISPECIES: hypothetical protein [unclassified Synechococcus]KZR85059.1 hypothetical protein MITS9504_02494 [Synechococcus sp. MIT S9504]KZR93795.1 hypothetical protein MITS9509_00390 [Synechococcus sp. MIT S9509]
MSQSDSKTTAPVNQHRQIHLGIGLLIALIMGMAISLWINSDPGMLPAADSAAGESVLKQYLRISHQLWLLALIATAGCLLLNIIRVDSKQDDDSTTEVRNKPFHQSIILFTRNNPFVTVLFIAYSIAMVAGTTYLYADLIGWYPDLINGHYLDNFSIKESFVKETMRRTDFRFFPLAHQDIHILSWFSINIKTWMLFNAGELIAITLLSLKFLNKLCSRKRAKESTLILLASLLLFHPSTGTTFFQVIYSERILCMTFILYINSYINYQHSKQKKDFYFALLWAVLGIFTKDTAIILFATPALATLTISSIRLWHQHQISNQARWKEFRENCDLEIWICLLSIAFLTSYTFLSLIPSLYAGEGAYNNDTLEGFAPDLRFYILMLMITIRAVAIISKHLQFNLLDAINIAAIGYTIALTSLYEFNSASYLTLPVTLITAINIGWAWMTLFDSKIHRVNENKRLISGSIAAAAMFISIEHLASEQTFTNTIIEMKKEQDSIQMTYNTLYDLAKQGRKNGKPVNIIISRKSRLSARRHLYRIPYRTLIEYEHNTGSFVIKDGGSEKDSYTPQKGDIIANLDKNISLISPILEHVETTIIYRHNSSEQTGMILKVKTTNPKH